MDCDRFGLLDGAGDGRGQGSSAGRLQAHPVVKLIPAVTTTHHKNVTAHHANVTAHQKNLTVDHKNVTAQQKT